jgi:phosphoribosyl 1,2-cyclic phosphodiesterase
VTLPFSAETPLRVIPLASGSKGNAWLIESGGFRLLMDDGLPVSTLAGKLVQAGLTLESLDGVVFTHHHNDHIAGAGPLLRKRGIPYWCSETAYRMALQKEPKLGAPNLIRGGAPFQAGPLTVLPVVVPHDAEETFALKFSAGGASFAYASDLGYPARAVLDMLKGSTLLAWEFNHDEELLANYHGYPEPIKVRIAGHYGHLSNDQAGAGLAELLHPDLQHLWLVHLSEKTNRPPLALQHARETLANWGAAPAHAIAHQHEAGEWVSVR